jgi:phytoene desaturase (3,4-didehydrolycopene-forming)
MAETSDPDGTSDQLELAPNAVIGLQVCDRHFTTTKDTLTGESGFFSSLLSGPWDNVLDDGSYFIDTDPTLFEHILRYLRRGVFPLFFDTIKGHDYHLYISLLAEARYFQIPRLARWLEQKRYLAAVRVENTADEYLDGDLNWQRLVVPPGATLEYYPRQVTRTAYVCPRCSSRHKRTWQASECCESEMAIIREEETSTQMIVVKRAVIFQPEVCMP